MSETKLFVSFRDHTVIQPGTGVVACFKAKEPRPLRESLVAQALAEGVVPYSKSIETALKEEVVVAEEEVETIPDAEEEPVVEEEETAETVAEAITILLKKGAEKDFGVTGEPKLASLKRILGRPVTADEREEAWAELNPQMPGAE